MSITQNPSFWDHETAKHVVEAFKRDPGLISIDDQLAFVRFEIRRCGHVLAEFSGELQGGGVFFSGLDNTRRVHENLRCQGLFRHLYDYSREYLRQLGIETIIVETRKRSSALFFSGEGAQIIKPEEINLWEYDREELPEAITLMDSLYDY